MSPAATAPRVEWRLPDRGRIGVVCLIVTEAALFTIFVVAYLFYIGKSLTGPYPNVLELPIWSTICLLSSSITVALAEHSAKHSRIGAFRIWLSLTILLGAEFLRQTGIEWKQLIEHDPPLTITTNLFGTTFYSLVGLHASHVTIGLLLLLLSLIIGLRGKTMLGQSRRFQFLSWYWHFVDAVWIVVFTVVYVVGR